MSPRLPDVPVALGRQDYVVARCLGRKVLHVGCTDQLHLKERYSEGTHLHARIVDAAAEAWGVDVDQEGIDFLEAKGLPNLLCADLTRDQRLVETLRSEEFDIIVATELLEHLENPGLMLRSLRRLMVPDQSTLIISVPNAFRLVNLTGMLRGEEVVHPDHNFWFSYSTITELLRKCGLAAVETVVYYFTPPSLAPSWQGDFPLSVVAPGERPGSPMGATKRDPIYRRLYRYLASFPRRLVGSLLRRASPFWGDGIILACRYVHDD